MKACPICHGPGGYKSKVGEYWLMKCHDCRFVYANATDEQIEQVNFRYGEVADCHYRQVQGGIDYLWFDRISAQLTRSRSGLTVLDIGCGNGILLRLFQKKGCRCTGCDPSPWARLYAQRYGYPLLPRIEEADIEPGSFDIITSTSTLEHIARPKEHVQRVFQLLKAGGIAFFTVPNYGSLPIRLHLVQGRLVNPPGHCNYFTRGTLRNLFRQKSLSDQVGKVLVRSYGIPELHGLYQPFTKIAGWVSGRKIAEKQDLAYPHGWTDSDIDNFGRSWLKQALIGIYYWSGATFGLGDKLEAWVEKRAAGTH